MSIYIVVNPRRKREINQDYKYIISEEITTKNFPNLKKETYPGTGSIQGPKLDKPKQMYTKIYYNKNSKI